MPKLTKQVVEKIEPKNGREIILWDSELPGFGVRVKPTGRRSYLIQYRSKGRSRRMTLGPHGVLTPTKARHLAIERLTDVLRGLDPAELKCAAITTPRMSELFERYLEQHARPKKKPSSVAGDERMWKLHVKRRLGAIPATEVNRKHIQDLHYALREKPIIANRVLAMLSKMFNLAERWGVRSDGSNPVRHVERYRENRVERFLSEAEMAELGKALRSAELEEKELASSVAAIRFLIFTGCRRGEALELRWDDVDLENGVARLRDSKTGPKTIVLNAPCRALLEDLPRVSDWVFPGRDEGGHLVGLTRPWYRIRKAAKLEDVRLHDLRHSFASVGVGSGSSLPIIGALLGHTQPVTTARYAHLANDPLKQASDAIGARIAAAMNRNPDADVLSISEAG